MSNILAERQSEIARRRVEIGKRFQLGEYAEPAKETTAAPDRFEALKLRSSLAMASGDVERIRACMAQLDELAGE